MDWPGIGLEPNCPNLELAWTAPNSARNRSYWVEGVMSWISNIGPLNRNQHGLLTYWTGPKSLQNRTTPACSVNYSPPPVKCYNLLQFIQKTSMTNGREIQSNLNIVHSIPKNTSVYLIQLKYYSPILFTNKKYYSPKLNSKIMVF